MKAEIKYLIKMQKYDDVITKKMKKVEELPKQLQGLKEDLSNAEAELIELQDKLKENLTQQKKQEIEIEDNKTKIDKHKNQLLDIKTNKQYKALNNEIKYLEKLNRQIDDETMAMMEKEENIREKIARKKRERDIAEKKLKKNEDKIKNKIKLLKKEITELRKNKKDYAAKLNRSLAKRYQRLIDNKNRCALAFETNNSCSSCGFKIRPQVLVELNQGEKIHYCENCGRLLVSQNSYNEINV